MLDVSGVGLAAPQSSHHRSPEATFTPTAAGLCTQESFVPGSQLDLQSMLSSALSSILAAGLQQAVQIPLQTLAGQQVTQEQLLSIPNRSPSCRESASPVDSDHGEECPEDIEFSKDEGLLPNTSAIPPLTV